MNLLLLDTSTEILMVGVSRDAALYSLVEENDKNHASLLALRIQEVLVKAKTTLQDLQGIVCTMGPGSFTGLRIGLSLAKGLGESLGIPLVGIKNLDAMGKTLESSSRQLAGVMDARKKRIYSRIYSNGQGVSDFLDISPEDFYSLYKDTKLLLCGPNPQSLFLSELLSPSWDFKVLKNWLPGMAILGKEMILKKAFIGPGEGPYYHRFGEEDLGITPRIPKLVE